VLLAGPPNVGKSVIFNRLTGLGTLVANYPGTTVDVAQGTGRLGDHRISLIDLPGSYSLSATNEAERVTTTMLREPADLVLIVADAVNLDSSIHLILEILPAGQPTVVALNRSDIAGAKGKHIDSETLAKRLGVPVIPTAAPTGWGLDRLEAAAADTLSHPRVPEPFTGDYWRHAEEIAQECVSERSNCPDHFEEIQDLEGRNPAAPAPPAGHPRDRTASYPAQSDALVHPWPGLLIAFGVLAVSFGAIVGIGMGVRQAFLLPIARGYLFPALSEGVASLVPAGIARDVLIGEYGFLIKGIEWPFTLVLPYVLSFYFVLALLEDSGYLPRLAILLDGLLGKIGLRGSHVISLLLGYGCAIPGILSTRAMGSGRERAIVATLISLAVPCIAQTGAIFALLAERSILLVVALFGLSFAVIAVAGLAMDALLPGRRSELILEIPELLVPQPRVLGRKLLARVRHFLVDGALPMVAAVGVAAVLYETRILTRVGALLSPIVTGWLRLPEEAATPLLLGVVRRELTVLPLLDMEITTLQTFVGATVGLFYVPCIAVVATLARELGLRAAIALLVLTVLTAFLLGGVIAQAGALVP